MLNKRFWIWATVLLLIAAVGTATAKELTQKERLGKLIFEDTSLSTPPGQICESCHVDEVAFADPRSDRGVSPGAVSGRFGLRNSPSIQYDFSPDFHFNESSGKFEGGQFRDGRANNLIEQEKLPFLNQLEINDPNKSTVIIKIRASNKIAPLFKVVYGKDSLDNVDTAYDHMAEALATYVKSSDLIKFTSKFDYYLAGKVDLTKQEKKGLELFNTPINTCSTCHITVSGPFADKPLFTDFTYGNPGGPSNLGMLGDSPSLQYYFPFYYPMPINTPANPDGLNFVDKGLGGALEIAGYPHDGPQGYANQTGKFKVPSLRNVAITAPYFHNGALRTLKEVVHLYNTRDTLGDCAKNATPKPSVNCWPLPEVPQTKNLAVGNLGLTDEEENDIVAFLGTLTDGFVHDDGNNQ